MNTTVNYTYRDASNYKQHEALILKGEITKEQESEIRKKLTSDERFIPSQVAVAAVLRESLDESPTHERLTNACAFGLDVIPRGTCAGLGHVSTSDTLAEV